MAQNAVISGATIDLQFPSGTQAGGQWRFTEQVGVGPVTTHLEDAPTTIFENLAAGSHTITMARLGVDGVTVLGDVSTLVLVTGANVTIQVAGSLTAQITTT